MRSLSWIPVSCRDIRTAKQIISSKLPDLMISDCLLYGETVIDLLVWMKLKGIDIPVIAVSAVADETLSEAVIKNGANCFYDKLDVTLCKIYEILEKHQSES